MLIHLITTQQNTGEVSRVEKVSNNNDLLNTTKLNSLILQRNFSFVLETCLENAYGRWLGFLVAILDILKIDNDH